MGARGEETRQKLLEAAARLIARRGLANVTSRDIVAEAGQRNTGALQYYFGSVDALVHEVVRTGRERLSASRAAALGALDRTDDAPDVRSLIGVVLRPLGALYAAPLLERSYISIGAQLESDPGQPLDAFLDLVRCPVTQDVAERLALLGGELPNALVMERIGVGLLLATQAFAYHARLVEAFEEGPNRIGTDLFVENVIDMTAAAITAPASPAAMALVEDD